MRRKDLESELAETKRLLAAVTKDFNTIWELISRIVVEQRTITVDASAPIPEGQVKWESGQTESGSVQTTIWYIPKATESFETTDEANNGLVLITGGREDDSESAN